MNRLVRPTVVLLALNICTLAWAQPVTLGSVFQFHRQAEPLPSPASFQGGVIYNLDAGVLFYSNGLTWAPIDASQQTTGDMRLFILPGGSDSNPCTEAEPCQTLARAFAQIPRTIAHRVTIFADAGVYPLSSAIFERREFAGGTVEVIGVQEPISVDGGSNTGTLSAVSNVAPLPVFTSTGQTWVVNSLKGARIRMTSGAASGNASVVLSNTADSLTLINVVPGTVLPGDAFILEQPATVFRADGGTFEAPVIIRDLRTPALATVSLADGGSFVSGEIRFVAVRLEQQGTGSRALTVEQFSGGRVAVNDSQLLGSVARTQGEAGLSLARSAVTAKPNQFALVVAQGAPTSTLIGPTLWTSTTSATWNVRDLLNVSFSTNHVIDRPATTTTASVYMSGGNIRALTSGSGTGLVITCAPSTGARGVLMDTPAVTPTNFISNDFSVPVLTVQGCVTGIVAETSSRVAIQTSTFTNVATVLTVNKGARVLLPNAPTVTGATTEILVDGTAFTFATLNSNSPQVVPLTPNPYGSWVAR